MQDESMELQLVLDTPRPLHRVRIYFVPGSIKQMPLYAVDYQGADGFWHVIRDRIEPLADRVYMRKKHPSFTRDSRQDISFAPVRARALRIRVVETRSNSAWAFADIRVSESAATPE